MRRLSFVVGLAVLGVTLASAAADQRPAANGQRIAADVQDFVYLGEARPVFVRMHIRVDGKPIQAGWDDFIKHLFNYLDVNGDGGLSKEEAERAPSAEQIVSGGVGRAVGGLGGMGGAAAAGPSMATLDADKDGKVTLAELAAYYRKSGMAPFQVQVSTPQGNPLGIAAAFLGGGRSEPTAAAVGDAIFALLDTGKDGKLTQEKLAAAPAVLLRLDEDEDEMMTPQELVPYAAPSSDIFGGKMMMMGRQGKEGKGAGKRNPLVAVATPGEAPADLVRALQERYGPKASDATKKKLSRKDLGLDEATFAQLDVDGDGALDADELTAFVRRAPDLELAIRLGHKKTAETRVEIVTGKEPPALASKVRVDDGLATLDLGATRVYLRGSDEVRSDRASYLLRQQYLALFKQADKDNKGHLDEKAVQGSAQFRGLFKAMDRDGDGKVTEQEMLDYVDHMQELQRRATAGCVCLVLSEESRGLFDALDVNGDGRLSVREMRAAARLLDKLDRDGNGYLTKTDIPKSAQLTLRRGPAAPGGVGGAAAFLAIFQGSERQEPLEPTRGPLWFRKMDRNRDGDVSRKEFLFGDELFRKIDTDGDGLISVEEAERYDAMLRERK